MVIPPGEFDDFEFELLEFEFELEQAFGFDFEFVEAPVEERQPAAGGNQAFALPGRETINPVDPTKTIAVQVTRSSSPPPPPLPQKEEEKAPSPISFHDDVPAAPFVLDLAAVTVHPPSLWYRTPYGEAEQYVVDDEDEDDDDYASYEAYYDFVDFGRARRVKPSSGRRGRTKKETAMGRPRGEKRSALVAGKC